MCTKVIIHQFVPAKNNGIHVFHIDITGKKDLGICLIISKRKNRHHFICIIFKLYRSYLYEAQRKLLEK